MLVKEATDDDVLETREMLREYGKVISKSLDIEVKPWW